MGRRRLGLSGDTVRLPLVPLSRQHQGPILEAMQSAGIAFA